jgi:hypothetical protein
VGATERVDVALGGVFRWVPPEVGGEAVWTHSLPVSTRPRISSSRPSWGVRSSVISA